jgi:hypothetical protein
VCSIALEPSSATVCSNFIGSTVANEASEIESQGLRPCPTSPFQTVIPSALDQKHKLHWLDNQIHALSEFINTQQQKLEWTGELRYQAAIDRNSSTRAQYQAERNTIEQFNSSAGALWACSGFQKEHLHDWSLSLAPNRSISNTLPPPDHPNITGPAKYEYVPSHAEIRSLSTKNVKSGSSILKRGRTTGVTAGIINPIRTDITLHNSQGEELRFTGWEITPSPANNSFIESGDSGAWAVDMDGNWCGVLFAQLSSGRGVMQDVKCIVEDIQRMTKCTVEL